jgi:hypothetical protein
MKKRIFIFGLVATLLAVISVLPVIGAPVAVVNMADTYSIRCSLPVRYMDGTYFAKVTTATLVISDNTTTTKGVITNATVTVTGYGTVAVVGFVGAGTHPRMSLIGSDGETVVNINAIVRLNKTGTTVASISGRMDGWRWHAGGSLGDDPAGATTAWSVVDSYNGSVSALLTQAAVEGSTYVSVTPPTGITLNEIDTLTTGWSFWHNLQDTKAYGPQVELRFTHPYNINPDGAGHVDITLLPHQEAGDGTWEQETLTSATYAGYYGNDPFDGTAFDEFSGTLTLADIETAINEEAAMTANGGFTCGDWVLTRVKVELWEAGARTCYVDDLTINGTVYTFEPLTFAGTFRATP